MNIIDREFLIKWEEINSITPPSDVLLLELVDYWQNDFSPLAELLTYRAIDYPCGCTGPRDYSLCNCQMDYALEKYRFHVWVHIVETDCKENAAP